MSFLVGPISGAVIAGGVYYGFSNLIQSRTEQHRNDLHALSIRMHEASSSILSPAPASARIIHNPFASLLKSRWNQEVSGLVTTIRGLSIRSEEVGRKLFYGTEVAPTEREQ